ncbi:hypothetical protein [Bradyrhizobium japonicum]|uniref:hypothetical protein n=1 Tax=Bradyrhizobium japonicum TaxID=375 RepID=UPI00046291D4|nr:hypothetical protein [Bradyrhizobium japonicum]
MGFISRLLAVMSGHKRIRIDLSEREGGYALVTSPDLPGFSVMLNPKDQEGGIDSMKSAIVGPLEAFVKAECEAVENHKHNKRVKIHELSRGNGSNLVAELCPS